MIINDSERQLAIQRLTALWALNESGLGGILHLFNTPFTGLLVGALAILLISLIGYFSGRGASKNILTAMFIVLIVKATVSPHSPLTAYIAVTFQSFLGIALFQLPKFNLASSILFGVIGLVESALQKLINLTIIYGNSLWEAIDVFGTWLSQKGGILLPWSSTKMLISTYLMMYIVGGIIIGFVIKSIIHFIQLNWNNSSFSLALNSSDRVSVNSGSRKKSNRYLLFVLIIAIVMASYIFINPVGGGVQKAILALLRAAVIIGIWYLLIGPFIMRFIHRYLSRKKEGLSQEVNHVFDIIPYLKHVIVRAWNDTPATGRIKKWKYFIQTTILHSLKFRIVEDELPH